MLSSTLQEVNYHAPNPRQAFFYPQYPGGQPEDWKQWFDDPSCFEFPPWSRRRLHHEHQDKIPASISDLFARELEVMSQIEYLAAHYCRPYLKKEFVVVVAVIPNYVWLQLKSRFTNQCSPVTTSRKKRSPKHSG